jgi:hypothetical protein
MTQTTVGSSVYLTYRFDNTGPTPISAPLWLGVMMDPDQSFTYSMWSPPPGPQTWDTHLSKNETFVSTGGLGGATEYEADDALGTGSNDIAVNFSNGAFTDTIDPVLQGTGPNAIYPYRTGGDAVMGIAFGLTTPIPVGEFWQVEIRVSEDWGSAVPTDVTGRYVLAWFSDLQNVALSGREGTSVSGVWVPRAHVPEPSSIALGALGLGAALLRRGRP